MEAVITSAFLICGAASKTDLQKIHSQQKNTSESSSTTESLIIFRASWIDILF